MDIFASTSFFKKKHELYLCECDLLICQKMVVWKLKTGLHLVRPMRPIEVFCSNQTHSTCIPAALSALSFRSELNVVSFFLGGIGGAESNRLCMMGGRAGLMSDWIRLNAIPSNCCSDFGMMWWLSCLPASPPPSSSNANWFDNIVEFSANGGNMAIVFGSWWNEFIELKPLSSSAELLATDLTRSFPNANASISLACELIMPVRRLILLTLLPPLSTGKPFVRPSKWLFSSSVSVRIDDELEWTDPSLVLLLWYELWLSRVFNLRCSAAGPTYAWSAGDFRSVNEFRWNDCNDFDSLRIGSLRFSRFWAVRYKRNASWDSFSASSSFNVFCGDFFGDLRLKHTNQNQFSLQKINLIKTIQTAAGTKCAMVTLILHNRLHSCCPPKDHTQSNKPCEIGEIVVRIGAVAGCCNGRYEWIVQLIFFGRCVIGGSFIRRNIQVIAQRSNVADATFIFHWHLGRLFDKHVVNASRTRNFVVLLHGFNALIAALQESYHLFH